MFGELRSLSIEIIPVIASVSEEVSPSDEYSPEPAIGAAITPPNVGLSSESGGSVPPP